MEEALQEDMTWKLCEVSDMCQPADCTLRRESIAYVYDHENDYHLKLEPFYSSIS